jgi:hypothetical protein
MRSEIEKSNSVDITDRYVGYFSIEYDVASIDLSEHILLYGGIGSINEETYFPTNIYGGLGLMGIKTYEKHEPIYLDRGSRTNFNAKLNDLCFAPSVLYGRLPDTLPYMIPPW